MKVIIPFCDTHQKMLPMGLDSIFQETAKAFELIGGVGKSTGNFLTATTFDFADDVEAAVSFIRSRPDLNHSSIGLMGQSEGGLIAPMVASRNNDVQSIVGWQ